MNVRSNISLLDDFLLHKTALKTLSFMFVSIQVFLIVAPLSVLYNWKDELDTWGHFRVVVVHGVRKDEELARVQRGRSEIALTTYETLRLCLDQFNRYIITTEWCFFYCLCNMFYYRVYRVVSCFSYAHQGYNKEKNCNLVHGLG